MHLIKDLFYVVLIFLAVYITFYLVHRHDTVEQRTARYDCSLTEFLADIPADVRTECRRRRIEQINQPRDQ